MEEILISLNQIKELHHRETGHYYNIVARPLLPRDFSRENWVWDDWNTVVIGSLVRVIIYGIWAKELMQVKLNRDGVTVAILATGSTLHNNFPTFEPNEEIRVIPQYLVPCKKKYEFSLLGYAVEVEGKTIALVH